MDPTAGIKKVTGLGQLWRGPQLWLVIEYLLSLATAISDVVINYVLFPCRTVLTYLFNVTIDIHTLY